MKVLMLALWPLILANVVMWYPVSKFVMIVWLLSLPITVFLLPERRWNP